MPDRADPRARERAFDIARGDPPPAISPAEAVAELRDVLDLIGDLVQSAWGLSPHVPCPKRGKAAIRPDTARRSSCTRRRSRSIRS